MSGDGRLLSAIWEVTVRVLVCMYFYSYLVYMYVFLVVVGQVVGPYTVSHGALACIGQLIIQYLNIVVGGLVGICRCCVSSDGLDLSGARYCSSFEVSWSKLHL
jgi:hypothetical protein